MSRTPSSSCWRAIRARNECPASQSPTKFLLPPSFKHHHCHGIGQVETTIVGTHGQTNPGRSVKLLQNRQGQSPGFRAKEKYISRLIASARMVSTSPGGQRKPAPFPQGLATGIPIGMHRQHHLLMVVQSSPTQVPITHLKAQWRNKVQTGSGIGTETNDITGIGRNFRLVQYHIEHGESLSVGRIAF
ncbi:conserved hypothetical protein [mine drainage metagenome]|uniref:Uncharacterized protein n=1 Tax=mine drainage metagenome TaxID=410659 RepID=A0A3P3ZRZ7_9ZZZZ